MKPVLTTIKPPQANAPVERVHQVILNMLVTKDLNNKVFDYIYSWGENASSIAWDMRAYYHQTIQATPGQAVFGRETVFNITSVVVWRIINTGKQQQVDIDNVKENNRRVMHDYTVGNLVYAETTGTYHRLDNKKQGPYRITEVFTNGTVQV